MIPLTYEENKSYRQQKVCYICEKGFSTDDDNKKYCKVRDHCHYTGKYRRAAHDIRNLRYKTPKEIPLVFHNGSTYNYHFIINELAKESNQVILLMITDGEKWHYLAITKLSTRLRGIISNHKGDFYCLNCEKGSFNWAEID